MKVTIKKNTLLIAMIISLLFAAVGGLGISSANKGSAYAETPVYPPDVSNMTALTGSELEFEEIKVGSNVTGYELKECSVLNPNADYVLYSSYNSKPIRAIQRNAFKGLMFNSLTIMHQSNAFSHSIEIRSGAFAEVFADSINILVDAKFEDDQTMTGYDEDGDYIPQESAGSAIKVFNYANVSTITIPNSSRITYMMFNRSTVEGMYFYDALTKSFSEKNTLPNSFIAIDTFGFAGCENLLELHIPSTVVSMGSEIFAGWGWGYEEQTIYIHRTGPLGSWDIYFDANMGPNAEIVYDSQAESYTVTLNPRNGTGETTTVEAYYGLPMPDAAVPASEYDYLKFVGYYDAISGGKQYYNSSMAGVRLYDLERDTILYARWENFYSNVTFEKGENADGGTNSVKAVYGQAMPALDINNANVTPPTQANSVFLGYFSGENGAGTQYYDGLMQSVNNWNKKDENVTLYAKWEEEKTTVTLNANEGSGGTSAVEAAYGKAMPNKDPDGMNVSAPERTGYDFDGYFDDPEAGAKYYNNMMQSAKNWDKTESSITLYAHWTAKKYKVTLDPNGGTNGTIEVEATFNALMPTIDSDGDALEKPTRKGFKFLGYYTVKDNVGSTKYYSEEMDPTSTNWTTANDSRIYACWQSRKTEITLYGGVTVTAYFDEDMPEADIPERKGSVFKGYVDNDGHMYYTATMASNKKWDKDVDTYELTPSWEKAYYTLIFDLGYSGETIETSISYGDPIMIDWAPYRTNYEFLGYYISTSFTAANLYIGAEVRQTFSDYYHIEPVFKDKYWNKYEGGTLYARWTRLTMTYTYEVVVSGEGYLPTRTRYITGGSETTLTAPTIDGYTFSYWNVNGFQRTDGSKYTFDLHRSYITGEITIHYYFGGSAAYSDGYFFAVYTKDPKCVAEGTLITLADGSQKAVETLTGNEMLLVWNLYTGRFEAAPILFIDKDAAALYKIINLYFSDGTHVKVIDEHAFWDFDLNRYVFLRSDAGEYIGHWFNKQVIDGNGGFSWTKVQLVSVVLTEEYTTTWSPVTFSHLCIYVNGMLSMPGGVTGLINIFEVESETMLINQAAFLSDIQMYGLFTYEEFAEIFAIPEIIFEAFNGQYLKVSIGKGLIDFETLGVLIERYAEFFDMEDQTEETPVETFDSGNHHGQINVNGSNGNHYGKDKGNSHPYGQNKATKH